MIVHDYLRVVKNGSIIIPPFHTGHLGLMPDSARETYLLSHPQNHHCEMVITSVPQNEEKITQLICVVKDQPGAVNKLVQAISSLGINIENQQSTSINDQNHHSINMILNWKEVSGINLKKESSPSILRIYNDFRVLFPINKECYIKLFDTIMSYCGNIICWNPIAGILLPQLIMRPIHIPKNLPSGERVKVTRFAEGKMSYNVAIKLNPEKLEEIAGIVNGKPDKLHYIPLSETEENRLRIFFPDHKMISKILHISFRHQNKPGALSLILTLLVKSEFNIITSLLRKGKTKSKVNEWEAILEYKGKNTIPSGDKQKTFKWLANLLLSNMTSSLSD